LFFAQGFGRGAVCAPKGQGKNHEAICRNNDSEERRAANNWFLRSKIRICLSCPRRNWLRGGSDGSPALPGRSIRRMLCSSFTVDAVSTESSSVEELSLSEVSLDLSYDHHSAACECGFSAHAPSWSALLTLMHSITAGSSQYSRLMLFAGEYVDRRRSRQMRTRMGLGIEG
jgi:hypothetical protein